jgi:hypothetical protein
VPYIARQGEAVAAGFGGGLFEAVDPAGCERYVGTRGGTEQSDGPADARRRSHHQDALACEISHHYPFLASLG